MTGMSALALLLLHTQGSRHARREPLPRLTDSAGVRWPLLAAKDAFAGSSDGGSRAGMIRELIWRLATTGAGTLVLAAAIFCTVPRLGRAAWRASPKPQGSIVGFSDAIALGQLGSVLESREHVMWVELTNQATGKAYPVQSRLYLRGAVVTHYEWSAREGARWRADIAGPWTPAAAATVSRAVWTPVIGSRPGRSSRRRRSSARKSPSIRWTATSCSASGRRSPIRGMSGSRWTGAGAIAAEGGLSRQPFHLQAGHDGAGRRPYGAARALQRSGDGRVRQRSAAKLAVAPRIAPRPAHGRAGAEMAGEKRSGRGRSFPPCADAGGEVPCFRRVQVFSATPACATPAWTRSRTSCSTIVAGIASILRPPWR